MLIYFMLRLWIELRMEKRYHLHIAMLSAVHFRMRHSTIHRNHAVILNTLLLPSVIENAFIHPSIHSFICHDKTSHSSFFLPQTHDFIDL